MGVATDSSPPSRRMRLQLSLFGTLFRTAWFVLLALTLSSELIPRPLDMTPVPLYSYTAAKAVAFLLWGFATPLAFWRFDSLGSGVVSSIAITAIIECAQLSIGGHRFSWLELAGKLALVFFGFMVALDCRYENRISIGAILICLRNPHEGETTNGRRR